MFNRFGEDILTNRGERISEGDRNHELTVFMGKRILKEAVQAASSRLPHRQYQKLPKLEHRAAVVLFGSVYQQILELERYRKSVKNVNVHKKLSF